MWKGREIEFYGGGIDWLGNILRHHEHITYNAFGDSIGNGRPYFMTLCYVSNTELCCMLTAVVASELNK